MFAEFYRVTLAGMLRKVRADVGYTGEKNKTAAG